MRTVAAFAGLTFTLLAALVAAPAPGEPVAAFFPPGGGPTGALDAALRAGAAEIIGEGAWRTVLVLGGGDAELPGRLRAAGAWLVVRAPIGAWCRTDGGAAPG